MISQFSAGAVEAMARISGSGDGEIYIAELEEQLYAIDTKLRHAVGDDITRLQGAAKTLEKLVNKFEASRENLRALNNHKA